MLTYIESWQGFNLVNLSSSLKDFKLAMADHCIKFFDCRLSYKFDKAKKEKRFFLFPKKPSEPNPRECQQFILFLQELVCWISFYRVLNLGLVFQPAKSKNLWKSAKSTWKCKLIWSVLLVCFEKRSATIEILQRWKSNLWRQCQDHKLQDNDAVILGLKFL